MNMIAPDEFARDVTQYDPTILVQMCGHVSRDLDKSSENLRQVTMDGQAVFVTHHALAELSMWAMRNHPDTRNRQPSTSDFFRLVKNVYSIQDPFLGTSAGGLMTLMRGIYEQYPYYQEPLRHLIPRHMMLYLESMPQQSGFDLDSAFRELTGLSVREFIMIGVILYSATLAHHTFDRKFIEKSSVRQLQPYIVPEKIDAFLRLAGADFDTFRRLRIEEESASPECGRFTFNPLLSRPVIRLPNDALCVPVPKLLIHRVTKGLYYDLLLAHSRSQEKGNPFAEWFGHAFQGYIGTLLKATFGPEAVYPEAAGIDWVLVVGDTAIVVECRSGRLPKKLRGHTDRVEVMDMIERNIVQPARKLPLKIENLRRGSGCVPTDKVESYIPAILTYQEWYPAQLTLTLARNELKGTHAEDFSFDLMSADDLEWLLAWARYEDPADVIRARHDDPEGKDLSIGQYVGIRAKRKNIKTVQNMLLSAKQTEFLSEILPDT